MEVISLEGFRMILGPDLGKALGETHIVQTSSSATSNLQGAQLKTLGFIPSNAKPSKYSNWKVDGTVPTYWFRIGPFTIWHVCVCAIYFDLG